MYRLTYAFDKHPEGIKKEDVPAGRGACDAVLLASIIYPPSGALSVQFVGHDGRTDGELADVPSTPTQHPVLAPGSLAPGDIVSLVSGGPAMTVIRIFDSGVVNSAPDGGIGRRDDIRCAWFVQTTSPTSWAGPFSDTFAITMLVLVVKRGTNPPPPVVARDPSYAPDQIAESKPDGAE